MEGLTVVTHDSVIAKYGVRDRGSLQSALARPAAALGGQDLYESVPERAAALLYSIVSNHAFVDVRLSADTDALEELTMAAASAHIGVEEIRIWIEQLIQRD